MTLSQYIEVQKEKFARIIQDERAIFLAANSALAAFSERVFDKGQSTSGQQFEYNSTTPLYVNPAKVRGGADKLKPPRGKPYNGQKGRTHFASTGDAHVTTWVESYKALRGLTDREDSFVNWAFQNDLRSDLENHAPEVKEPKTVKKVSDRVFEIKTDRPENFKKLEGLKKRYSGVFELSDSEEQLYYTTLEKEYLKLLRS